MGAGAYMAITPYLRVGKWWRKLTAKKADWDASLCKTMTPLAKFVKTYCFWQFDTEIPFRFHSQKYTFWTLGPPYLVLSIRMTSATIMSTGTHCISHHSLSTSLTTGRVTHGSADAIAIEFATTVTNENPGNVPTFNSSMSNARPYEFCTIARHTCLRLHIPIQVHRILYIKTNACMRGWTTERHHDYFAWGETAFWARESKASGYGQDCLYGNTCQQLGVFRVRKGIARPVIGKL